LHDGKRYRKYNNYLTGGAGFLTSSLPKKNSQKSINVDYQFHIKRQHFQVGLMMSGNEFTSNNNSEIHFGYGRRKERKTSNLAFFVGPTYFTGVETIEDTIGGATFIKPRFYKGFGAYGSVQAITKFTYDIGIGIELYGEVSAVQRIFGAKIILFFSGAYRGPKKNYNPHVKSENNK
jgi:hypothetical protein